MDRLRRAEAGRPDVVAFEDVEHLRDVDAGRRGRRRAQNFPAAIIAPDRQPLDGLDRGEIVARDEAAMRLHVVDQDVAERAAIERAFAVLRDIRQRLRIFRLHHALAGLERRAVRQIDRRDRLVPEHDGRAVADAFVQIGRGAIAARGVPDRGLHDVGERHGAEAAQGLAPGLQRARRGNRLRPVEVLVVDGVEHVMRRAGLAAIGVGLHRQRHRALAVDEAMAAVSGADMRHAAADDADHHRLDHGQREQGRDRGIDGVAARGQHLRAGARRPADGCSPPCRGCHAPAFSGT